MTTDLLGADYIKNTSRGIGENAQCKGLQTYTYRRNWHTIAFWTNTLPTQASLHVGWRKQKQREEVARYGVAQNKPSICLRLLNLA